MDELYSSNGVQFRFPSFWELSEEPAGNELTITVFSPETSFWSLTLIRDKPRPEDVIKSAVAALREEYDELDDYVSQIKLCGRDSVACDLEFVCLEMLNSAFLRAFRTDDFSALIYYQGTDQELAETRPILESISLSLKCGEDGELPGKAALPPPDDV